MDILINMLIIHQIKRSWVRLKLIYTTIIFTETYMDAFPQI